MAEFEIGCANPACLLPFKPKRPWQKYCCPQCRVYRLSEARVELLEGIVREASKDEKMPRVESAMFRALKKVDAKYRPPKR